MGRLSPSPTGIGSARNQTPNPGVSSFNGRTGNVTPTSGDYTAAQVGAVANSPGSVTLPLTATGVNGLAAQSFSVYRNAAQTLSTAAGTKVAFDTREFDVSSTFDITTNNRVTPTIAGYYSFSSLVELHTALSVGQSAVIVLYKNGVAYKFGQELYASAAIAADQASVMLAAQAQANGTTDFFEIFISFVGPASVSVFAGIGNNYFDGRLIGKS